LYAAPAASVFPLAKGRDDPYDDDGDDDDNDDDDDVDDVDDDNGADDGGADARALPQAAQWKGEEEELRRVQTLQGQGALLLLLVLLLLASAPSGDRL
jgi:hypothetical protein